MTESAGPKRSRITWSPEERAEWLATLSLWRNQMPEVIDEPSGALVEVVPRLTPPSPPSGWRIEVPVSTDAVCLRDLLQASPR